jgi:hypothetical protein
MSTTWNVNGKSVRTMKTPRKLTMIVLGTVAAMLFAAQALAQPTGPAEARNVVLVHGAWADGSSWSEVIARLQATGLRVTAVQNPLTSLADSVAATRCAFASPLHGPFHRELHGAQGKWPAG